MEPSPTDDTADLAIQWTTLHSTRRSSAFGGVAEVPLATTSDLASLDSPQKPA